MVVGDERERRLAVDALDGQQRAHRRAPAALALQDHAAGEGAGHRAQQQQGGERAVVVEADLAQEHEADEQADGDDVAVFLEPVRRVQRLGDAERARRLVGGRERADVAPHARGDHEQQRQRRDDHLPHQEQARVGVGDQQPGDDEREGQARPPGSRARRAGSASTGSACSWGTRSWPSARPPRCVVAGAMEAGREDAAQVEQDGAAQVRAARGEAQEGLVAEAQDLGVGRRGDASRRAGGRRGTPPRRTCWSAARRRWAPAAGRRRACRARGRARPGSGRPARRGSAGSRCGRAAGPSPPRRAPRGSRGASSSGTWLPGYWKKPVVSMVTARSASSCRRRGWRPRSSRRRRRCRSACCRPGSRCRRRGPSSGPGG